MTNNPTNTNQTDATDDERAETTAADVLRERNIDPVTMQVIGGELDTIAQEMGYKLIRSSYSSIIRESEDMGAGIFTTDCRELCESDSTPMHVGSLIGYLDGMYKTFEERGVDREDVINEGDVFIHNHPHYGASHSPDIAVAVPIFYEGEHIAWAANTAHHLDIGSATPGLAIDLEDMYAEGSLFRATKVYEEGERVDGIWDFIEDNVRTPREVIGDLQAQISSCNVGKDRYLDLVEKYGLEEIQHAGEALMDYAEALLRNEIRTIPDGTYYAEDYLDDDGRNRDVPLKIAAEVTVDGSDITVDMSKSADQTPTGYNVPFHGSTDVCIYFTIRSLLMDTFVRDEYLPQNSGTFAPVHPKARPGCMFNPTPPTSAFARINQVDKMSDLIIKALADAIPERVCAGTCGQVYFVSYGGTNDAGEYWVYLEVNEGSYGGRPGADGLDAVDALVHNTKNRPVEDIELSHPMRLERYGLREDGHGAGRTRGGHGIVRESRFLTDAVMTMEGDGNSYRPHGLFGGGEGTHGDLQHIKADGEVLDLHSKESGYKFEADDRVLIKTASGGGYGDPHERPADTVYEDYLDGLVSATDAREEYGVVIEDGTLDTAATAELRGE
ncbi:hydantoinase B/oxoprolinase family protein [Natronorubrum sp. DTA7]|uniref:hydantoinase B/oxoprolinase family protein n=1 Tax=Natronorubrum sp. DTA7 TaxID=3447016 RepID=UPI003F85F4B1